MFQVKSPPGRPQRTPWWPSLGQLVLVALTWSVAAVCVLYVAATTRVGPVLYEFNDRHGVHALDVLVSAGAFCLALLVTAVIVWPRRRRH